MRLECIGASVLRDDLAEEPANGLEQDKTIAIRDGRTFLLQCLGDGRKARFDFAKG